MSSLCSTMSDTAQSLEKDAAALTDNCIKLRNTLLELQPKITNVDAYTNSGSEENWKAIRSKYDTFLNSLNATARVCADTIGEYVAILPLIDQAAMFEDARVELGNMFKNLEAEPQEDLSAKLKELEESIVQFISRVANIIANKNEEVDIASAEAENQASHAQAEVNRLKKEEADRQRSYLSKSVKGVVDDMGKLLAVKKATAEEKANLKVKDQITDAYHQVANEPTDEVSQKSKADLKAAENQLAQARETQAKVQAQLRARQYADWPLTSTSLDNTKTLLATVGSKHLVIDNARQVLVAEVNGHLAAFDAYANEKTSDNQLALANYHRKARDNEPKLVSVQKSLGRFASEFK